MSNKPKSFKTSKNNKAISNESMILEQARQMFVKTLYEYMRSQIPQDSKNPDNYNEPRKLKRGKTIEEFNIGPFVVEWYELIPED